MSPAHYGTGSQPAVEERQLLGMSREQQAQSINASPTTPQGDAVNASFRAGAGLPSYYKLGDAQRLASIIYAEADNNNDVMNMVGSSVLNRLESGKFEEFGGDIENVIYSEKSPYYATKDGINTQMEQARMGKFPDDKSENKFKKALQIANGLIRGTIPRHKAMFFFTGSEISGMKRKKNPDFDFKKVKETGKVRKYHTYSY